MGHVSTVTLGNNLGIWCQRLYDHELDGGKRGCTARGGDAARCRPGVGRELFTNGVGNLKRGKTSNSKYSWVVIQAILQNVVRFLHISALNISVMTASIEIVFTVKIFQKYILLGQQKKSRVNFE